MSPRSAIAGAGEGAPASAREPRLCAGGEHAIGQWQHWRHTEAPPCCGNFALSAPACASKLLAPMSANACSCSGMAHDNRSYAWRPTHCRLTEWNGRRWCDLLGNRTVLFVGDSTMEQTAVVFRNFVAWSFRLNGTDVGGGSCAAQHSFTHSDTVIGKRMGRLNRGVSLGHAMTIQGANAPPSLVVTSASAHIYGEANVDRVLDYVADIAARHPNTTFVWKTSQPGGCEGGHPLTEFPNATHSLWRSISNVSPPDRHKMAAGLPATHLPPRCSKGSVCSLDEPIRERALFNWRNFSQRDERAKARFYPNVLDLTPLYYRPDAHISSPGNDGRVVIGHDCLHFCYGADGGPLNVVPQVLLHMLEIGQISLKPA